ncbi:hypothetical protein RJT34_07700 [Clitoria ternatea]|uniref:Uncharacterized protein n=1 Tax=Clitoria ternatea TaxID=43366 RepID=A0AAN9K5E9_CLITE
MVVVKLSPSVHRAPVHRALYRAVVKLPLSWWSSSSSLTRDGLRRASSLTLVFLLLNTGMALWDSGL